MKTDPENKNPIRALSHPEQSTDNIIPGTPAIHPARSTPQEANKLLAKRRGEGNQSSDLYSRISGQIMEMLTQGVAPWRSGILATGAPQNLEGRLYRGVNVFLLSFTAWKNHFASPYWLTFRQAEARGETIKRGEKGTMVVFWKQRAFTDDETGEIVTAPVLRYYTVFNLDQCEGVAEVKSEPIFPIPVHPIAEAERIVRDYADAPVITHEGTQAYYLPAQDHVFIPRMDRFSSAADYYATLFHELAHSTGHSKRLDRGLDSKFRPYGSAEYGKEELIAEMAGAFLCSHASVAPTVIENQAAYIDGWLKTIEHDKRLVITAAGAAQKAADLILGTAGRTPPTLAPISESASKKGFN